MKIEIDRERAGCAAALIFYAGLGWLAIYCAVLTIGYLT